MELLGFYIAGVVLNLFIAVAKNRNIWGIVIFSILISPLFPFLYLLAVPKLEAK